VLGIQEKIRGDTTREARRKAVIREYKWFHQKRREVTMRVLAPSYEKQVPSGL